MADDRDPDAFITRREARGLAVGNADLIGALRRSLFWVGVPLVIGVVLLFGLTWATNKASCDRAAPLRSALVNASVYFDGQAARADSRSTRERGIALTDLDQTSARAARVLSDQLAVGQLDCGKFIP